MKKTVTGETHEENYSEYGMFDEDAKKLAKADKEITQAIKTLAKLMNKYSEMGAGDTSVREEIYAKIDSELC